MEEIIDLSKKWVHWHYKNTSLLIFSLIIFFFLTDTSYVKDLIYLIGSFGYLGALFAGIFFVSVFSVAPASVVLFHLASLLNPLLVAIFAGVGAVVGDYLIFRFLRDRVFEELRPLFLKSGGNILLVLFKTPYFGWMLPFIGAVIIASPLPDEIGIGMLGSSKLRNWQFLILSFLLNSVGIFIVIIAARSF